MDSLQGDRIILWTLSHGYALLQGDSFQGDFRTKKDVLFARLSHKLRALLAGVLPR